MGVWLLLSHPPPTTPPSKKKKLYTAYYASSDLGVINSTEKKTEQDIHDHWSG